MPTYSYRCTECGEAFDVQQSFTDDSLTVCPHCGGVLRKIFSPVGVSFTGSGFYRNDSRAKPAESGGASGSDGSGSSSGAGSSEKSKGSEAKPTASSTDSASKSSASSKAGAAAKGSASSKSSGAAGGAKTTRGH